MGLRGPGAKPTSKGRRKKRSWEDESLSAVDRVQDFISSLKLTAGRHAGKAFDLRHFQKQIIAGVYRGGVRQALVTMGRKNGKTQLAAVLAGAHLFGPMAEPRGEVYSAASDRNQSARIFRELVALIEADKDLSQRCNVQRFAKKIEVLDGPGQGSIYEALSSDARKAHSLSPSFVVCDELAQWPSRELYDNLITGTGARENPLVVVISTMSSDPNHVMSELVDDGNKINAGAVDDPSFVAFIFSTSMDADPWDESNWYASNPALGDFRSLDEMRQFAQKAKRIPAQEAVFRNLYLNQPVSLAAKRFVPLADWQACGRGPEYFDPARLRGRRCYGAIDLSSTGKNDLTALVLHFEIDDHILVVPYFWACESGLEEAEKRDRVPYRLWAKQKYIEAIPARVMDYGFVANKLAEICAEHDLQVLGCDPYKMDHLVKACEDIHLDLKIQPHGQSFKDMDPSILALEDEILSWKLIHPRHPVLDSHMDNVKIELDSSGNRKFSKRKSIGRIDGAVGIAMVEGIAKAWRVEEAPSIFAI